MRPRVLHPSPTNASSHQYMKFSILWGRHATDSCSYRKYVYIYIYIFVYMNLAMHIFSQHWHGIILNSVIATILHSVQALKVVVIIIQFSIVIVIHVCIPLPAIVTVIGISTAELRKVFCHPRLHPCIASLALHPW